MTTTPTPTVPDNALALAKEADKATALVRPVQTLTITSTEQRQFVNDVLVWTKGLWKELEAERTSATKPMNAALKTVNGWFKPRQDICKTLEDACKTALWHYDRALQAEQQKQLQAAAEAYQAGETQAATTALAAIPDIPTSAGTSVGTRKVLRIVAPDMVPREYCSPDPKKLALVMPGQMVPGCVWEEQAAVRVTIGKEGT